MLLFSAVCSHFQGHHRSPAESPAHLGTRQVSASHSSDILPGAQHLSPRAVSFSLSLWLKAVVVMASPSPALHSLLLLLSWRTPKPPASSSDASIPCAVGKAKCDVDPNFQAQESRIQVEKQKNLVSPLATPCLCQEEPCAAYSRCLPVLYLALELRCCVPNRA